MSVRCVQLKELWVEGRRVGTALCLTETHPPFESRRLRKCGLRPDAPPEQGQDLYTYIQAGHVHSVAHDHIDELIRGAILSEEYFRIEDL